MAQKISAKIWTQPHREYILLAICWLILCLSLVWAYASFAAEINPRASFYTSDTLYLPALFQDWQSGYSLRGATLIPGRPYIFPDMLLFFLLNSIFNNFHIALIANGVIQCLCLVVGMLLVSNYIYGLHLRLHMLLLLTASGFFFLFSTGVCQAYSLLFLPAMHFVTVLAIIASFLCIIQIIRDDQHPSKRFFCSLGLFFLSSAMLSSDIIYLVQCVLPSMVGLSLLCLCSQAAAPQVLPAFIALSASLPAYWQINQSLQSFWPPPPSSPKNSSKVMAGIVGQIEKTVQSISNWLPSGHFSSETVFWLFVLLWGGFLCIGLIIVARSLFGGQRRRSSEPLVFRIAMLCCCAVNIVGVVLLAMGKAGNLWVSCCAILFSGGLLLWRIFLPLPQSIARPSVSSKQSSLRFLIFVLSCITINLASFFYIGGGHPRYVLPIMIFPIFCAPFLGIHFKNFQHILQRKYCIHILIGIITLLVVPANAVEYASDMASLASLSDYYPDFIRCVDEHAKIYNLQNGLAQYWEAKQLTMLSHHKLNVVSVRPKLHIDLWQTNVNRYANDFDFVVTSKKRGDVRSIRIARVRAQFGREASSFTCADKKILVYNRPKDTDFQKQFKQFFTLDFLASDLPSETGRLEGNSRIATEKIDPKGFLTYGPYADLFIGDYAFELNGSAQQAKNEKGIAAASWEMLLHQKDGGIQILKRGHITQDGAFVLSENFKIRRYGKTEIRVYYNGVGTLQIDTLAIRRIR